MNLSSSYLGLDLRNPLVASAGPMTQTADRIERLAEAGVGAVVLPSLFEEQIRAEADRDERLAEVGTDSFGEATSYLIDPDASLWPRQYLDLVQRAATRHSGDRQPQRQHPRRVDRLSPCHAGRGRRRDRAEHLLPAGRPPPGSASPFASGPDAEQRYVDILTAVKSVVSVPVAVKLAPYFSSLGDMALRLERAGADGLVLFNRFMQTDIDPETRTVSTGFKLSSPAEATLSRSWIARLRGQARSRSPRAPAWKPLTMSPPTCWQARTR